MAVAQRSKTQYYHLLAQARSLYNDKEYLRSAQKYSQLFNTYKSNLTANDYYDAACCYSLSGMPDSAILYLSITVNQKKYDNLSHVQSDSDLISLHDVKGWNKIIEKVNYNKQQAEKGYNRPIVSVLDSIYNFDQRGRKVADDIGKRNGVRSAEMKKYLHDLGLQDSINLIKVTSIIDKNGWLGPDKVGEQGNTTLFLVIQHADKNIHEKYLPIMRQAVRNGYAKAEHLALLEDRTALEEGKGQIYGSQIIRDQKTGKPAIAPIVDEKNVDVRRESVGLGPIKEYAKLFQINYRDPGNNAAN